MDKQYDTLSSSDTVNNIKANEWYILHVQDINGCFTFDSIQLTEPTPLQIDSFTINNVICVGGDRGNATVWVSGATLAIRILGIWRYYFTYLCKSK